MRNVIIAMVVTGLILPVAGYDVDELAGYYYSYNPVGIWTGERSVRFDSLSGNYRYILKDRNHNVLYDCRTGWINASGGAVINDIISPCLIFDYNDRYPVCTCIEKTSMTVQMIRNDSLFTNTWDGEWSDSCMDTYQCTLKTVYAMLDSLIKNYEENSLPEIVMSAPVESALTINSGETLRVTAKAGDRSGGDDIRMKWMINGVQKTVASGGIEIWKGVTEMSCQFGAQLGTTGWLTLSAPWADAGFNNTPNGSITIATGRGDIVKTFNIADYTGPRELFDSVNASGLGIGLLEGPGGVIVDDRGGMEYALSETGEHGFWTEAGIAFLDPDELLKNINEYIDYDFKTGTVKICDVYIEIDINVHTLNNVIDSINR